MSTGPSTFLGRGAELATFERLVAGAAEGSPGVVLLGGEAGIGKTTLVVEAAQRSSLPLLVGRSAPMAGETIPLAPLSELLRGVRRRWPDAIDDDPRFAVLRDWLLLDRDALASPAGRLFGPTLDLLAALAPSDPLLVVIEDLHWADPVTWDFVDHVARTMTDEHLVLVATYRSDEVSADPTQRKRLGELARVSGVERMLLGGLGRDDIAARISTRLAAPVPQGLVDEILARGQGNPFFTDELVSAHLSGDAIPAILSDLIAGDLERLDEAARGVAAVVAAAGHDTTHDLLAAVAGLPEPALEAALRELVDARLLVVDAESSSYRFRHALIGEVVYDGLLPSERVRLHQRLAGVLHAGVLEAEPPSERSRPDRLAELAFHLDRAKDLPAAFTVLLAAADATEAFAPAAAFRQLERALEIWDDAGDATARELRADRMWQAADLASATVSNDLSVDMGERALSHGVPSRGAAWAHERLARALWGSGRLDASEREYAHAAALIEQSGDEPGRAAATAGLAQGMLMFGRYAEAETRATRVLDDVADCSDDPFAWVTAQRVLGVILIHRGDVDAGLARCRAAVEAAPSAQVRALATLYNGVGLIDAGRHREARDLALAAAAESQVTGVDPSFGPYSDAIAAEALVHLGSFDEADAVLARRAGSTTLPVGRLRRLGVSAMLAARRDDEPLARTVLGELAAVTTDPWHQVFVSAATADVLLALGDWPAAADVAARGWDSTIGQAPQLATRFLRDYVAAVVEATLDRLARREKVDRAQVIAELQRRVDATVAAFLGLTAEDDPHRAALLADAAASLSRLTASDAEAWADVASRWSSLEQPLFAAQARLHEAEALAVAGETARAADALRAAHHLASTLGAPRLTASVDALSRRTRISTEPMAPRHLSATSADQLGLTAREAEVLALVAAGRTNSQIGDALFISEKTASVHVSNILRKLGVATRMDAAAIAQRLSID